MNYRISHLLVFLLHYNAYSKQRMISLKVTAVLSQTFQENARPPSLSPRLSIYIILYRLVTQRHMRRVIDSH